MPAAKWNLYGFMDAVREWMRYDPPPNDLLVRAVEFGAELERNPESRAVLEYANLFYREMPDTVHDGWIVSITFTLHRPRDPGFAGEVHCQTVCCTPHPPQELVPAYPPPRHH